MTIRERMSIYQSYRNISDYAIEKALGKSKGYWHTCKNPTAGIIQLFIETFPDISAEWLLRGEGDMLRSPESAGIVNNNNIHSQKAHNINNGSGSINETQASSNEIIELLKQQNATLTQQVASLTEVINTLTKK